MGLGTGLSRLAAARGRPKTSYSTPSAEYVRRCSSASDGSLWSAVHLTPCMHLPWAHARQIQALPRTAATPTRRPSASPAALLGRCREGGPRPLAPYTSSVRSLQ
eukprot:scaffold254473_cov32-Tisochrysis_lutea.AAC.3